VLPVKFDIRTPEAIQAVEEQLGNSGKLNGRGGSHAAAVALPKLVSAADLYPCEPSSGPYLRILPGTG